MKSMQNKDLHHVNDTNVVEYEQQLWDRVYLKAFDEIHEMHPTTLSSADVAYSAADIADAFMAERAKRLHKQD